MKKAAEILLVEDSPGDVVLVREALEDNNFESKLHVVRDGIEALSFLRQHHTYSESPRPDIIILDLNLPGKDGREFLRDIKADSRLRKIPVIVLSTSENESDINMCYQSYANCYITKPMDFEQFTEIIKFIQKFWFDIVKLPAV